MSASEKSVRPAARSTVSTEQIHKENEMGRSDHWPQYVRLGVDVEEGICAPGTTKLSRGASSGMIAFGRTNAPAEISGIFGVEGDEGREVRTTLAKWVGTPMFGGLPITS